MASEIRTKPRSSFWERKRSDIDIIANILREANRGIKKTRIMYRCNLSHKQLKAYLQLLLEMGLLTPPSKKEKTNLKSYKTTSKGLEFLKAYRVLKSLMT